MSLRIRVGFNLIYPDLYLHENTVREVSLAWFQHEIRHEVAVQIV